jgi:Arc/MetJ-type ribon-helix-helix transcriptional regulator
MTIEIPSELLPFIERMVSQRRLLNEREVLIEGLRLLEARETLREEVGKGFAQLDAGQGVPASEVYSRVAERIRAIESGEA